MLFNLAKKYNFPPEFSFQNGEILESCQETKLLGIQLNTSLKWNSNTQTIYLKAMSRMWLLRRLKMLKLEYQFIFEYYVKEIRPLAEHGVAIWNSGLTKVQINNLEKIQKVALRLQFI